MVYSAWSDLEAVFGSKLDHFIHQLSMAGDREHATNSLTAPIVDGGSDTLWSSPQDDPYDALQEPVSLCSLCPSCFGENPKAEIGFISFDGNFQQKRFPTSKNNDNTYLELRDKRLFIDDGNISLQDVYFPCSRFSDPRKGEYKDPNLTTCSRNFKAAAETGVTKRVVDSGLIAVVCRCGVPLRLYNVRKTGERAIYVLRLLQSILDDPSCPPKLMLLYDINCVFAKYVKVWHAFEFF